ncbi:DUF2087 domain-containing protein [Jeotgalibacillus haloalkalitolerans]|uniref:DUF2087 domain-containing protein n=1 Tax=Jeotgalibacillus haloalkalitolerans TaxID=3104292 RepID=A0ABU5KRH9_9BACL|nr:DUF2087 domain-containing protein [Jeotgalibacillus sp. HH7-29]MDZ5713762.1 DUF2087 domain-containing protein [Jeotgalibacillus sp. HH7-29]
MFVLSELFWEASVEELTHGVKLVDGAYCCLVCGERFEEGEVFQVDGRFFEAYRAAEVHVQAEHESMFVYLMNMDKKYTGLSDHQKELLSFFKQGVSDKEAAKQIGGSPSTIRNHRFKFKEKEKQARVFLALMQLLKEETGPESLVHIHRGATMVDERYAITTEEQEKVLKTYFKEDGTLSQFPSKEKKKIVVLQYLLKRFNAGQQYTEREVNEVIKQVYADFVTIRRYFIEYGFMDRNQDGSAYWIKS